MKSKKKIRFLKQFIADMKLPNVEAVQTRVEDEESIAELGKFELITSRAFASLTDFVRLSEPYLFEKSTIIAMKGVIPHEELTQLCQYQQQIIELSVPHLDEQRHLVVLTARQQDTA